MISSCLEAIIVFKEDELMSRTALSNRNIMQAPDEILHFSVTTLKNLKLN